MKLSGSGEENIEDIDAIVNVKIPSINSQPSETTTMISTTAATFKCINGNTISLDKVCITYETVYCWRKVVRKSNTVLNK